MDTMEASIGHFDKATQNIIQPGCLQLYIALRTVSLESKERTPITNLESEKERMFRD